MKPLLAEISLCQRYLSTIKGIVSALNILVALFFNQICNFKYSNKSEKKFHVKSENC